jgi:hypothetical protein
MRQAGVAVALALSIAACGGTTHRSTTVPMRETPKMAPTPAAALALCQRSKLLRPVCPRRIPRASAVRGSQRWLGVCTSTHGNGGVVPLSSPKCVEADWIYEASSPLRAVTPRSRLGGWDGTRWVAIAADAGMEPPPLHIHVDIAASRATAPLAVATAGLAKGEHPATDALLNPTRTSPVSLGSVRWYSHRGQLVLAPLYPTGAEWGGHLFFEFTAHGISYAVTLHAWFPRLRVTTGRTTKVLTFEPGASLPVVIATLKRIVGSAPGR